MTPLCTGCNKTPREIEEYREAAMINGTTPDDYVRENDGTYNKTNGHFLCTNCYIEAGQPCLPYPSTWTAP